MAKKKSMLKNLENKIEHMGHDMASGIKSFGNTIEEAGHKMSNQVKKAEHKMFDKKK